MKFFDAMKARKDVSPEVQALEKQLGETAQMPDAGERLLAYSRIYDGLETARRGKFLSLVKPVMGAVTAVVFALGGGDRRGAVGSRGRPGRRARLPRRGGRGHLLRPALGPPQL